ncbi:MAG: hypothetical protein D6806_02000 [Deltaproteobacteria bacterium]|nr:MAG: hypothetical protein D6806_02000 [Deltaproteobacteria bacterium]
MNAGEKRRAYLNPYLGGTILGLVLFLSFLLTGHGLGASGGVHRVVTAVEKVVVPGHVTSSPYLAEMGGAERNPLDNWIVLEILGVLLGGLLSGWLGGRIKVETYHGPRITRRTRWAMAFLGGSVVGYAVRMARGCTSGQALSGGATLSVGSWAFMFSVFAGAFAMAWFVRRLWTEGGAS